MIAMMENLLKENLKGKTLIRSLAITTDQEFTQFCCFLCLLLLLIFVPLFHAMSSNFNFSLLN